MAVALPLALQAAPEIIGMAGTAFNAAKAVAPFLSKYAPTVKKLPRFISHLSKSPIETLKALDIQKALMGVKDLTTDIGRTAAHLESATGHNKYLSAAKQLPTLTHEYINKATKFSHHFGGYM